MDENGGFLKTFAHAPIKDGIVFSHHFVFVWTDKTCSKRICVDADVPFSNKKGYVSTGPLSSTLTKSNKNHCIVCYVVALHQSEKDLLEC